MGRSVNMELKTAEIQYGGETFVLNVERSLKAGRMRLRIDRRGRCAVLVLPRRASESVGLAFARSKADWIAGELSKLPERKVFADGMPLSFLGLDVVIHHSPAAKRGVWMSGGVIWVSGQAEHLPRRVRDFLKEEFRQYASRKVRETADRLGVKISRVSVRDTTSRWGSCNRDGNISLSWRLGLAPLHVLDYVIAHEAAHLRQMNHSPAFWRVVEEICPEYKLAELWLKRNTAYLYSFDV